MEEGYISNEVQRMEEEVKQQLFYELEVEVQLGEDGFEEEEEGQQLRLKYVEERCKSLLLLSKVGIEK